MIKKRKWKNAHRNNVCFDISCSVVQLWVLSALSEVCKVIFCAVWLIKGSVVFVDLAGTAVRLLLARNLKCHFPCHAFLGLLGVQSILTISSSHLNGFQSKHSILLQGEFLFCFSPVKCILKCKNWGGESSSAAVECVEKEKPFPSGTSPPSNPQLEIALFSGEEKR